MNQIEKEILEAVHKRAARESELGGYCIVYRDRNGEIDFAMHIDDLERYGGTTIMYYEKGKRLSLELV